jgi:hypothetical protein
MDERYTMTQAGKLTDPNFAVDSHGGYCTVRIADSLSVVVINNISSIEVEIYRNTEDDAPIETMQFPKGDYNDTIK